MPWQVTAIILVVMVGLVIAYRFWPTPPLSAEAEAARQTAIEKFDEINGSGHHLQYNIMVSESRAMGDAGMWMVSFSQNRPDGGFTIKIVTIDKATGEITSNQPL